MKEMFKWYFPLTEKEISDIWESGLLTVDTNALLDLYRYHEDTRSAILKSLESFKGRSWISNQVAEEFFRNRNGVIVSSGSAFNDSSRNIAEIRKSVEEPIKKLKSNRIMPDEVADNLEKSIAEALKTSECEIEDAREKYPNYRDKDPILEIICTLFDGAVGAPFDDAEATDALKEGKKRKDNKIPPGFNDSGKDGDKPFGDYFLWRQILNHIKETKKPLIFVTSEQKDDWWEKRSGKTIGPHYELIKEFYQFTNQRFLFYRTDRFLEFALKRIGDEASSEAVNEIREVASQRLRSTPLVSVKSQDAEVREPEWHAGKLIVKLIRPTYKFTCSGHLEPEMADVPKLDVKLVDSPPDIPQHIIRSGTGTTFDFNIHIKSTDYGIMLPTGVYVFEYEAISNQSDIVGD